jgi:hypothetical protein
VRPVHARHGVDGFSGSVAGVSSRTRLALIASAIVVLAAVAAVAIFQFGGNRQSPAEADTRPDPRDAALAYLEAIAAGDAETANAMADPLVDSAYELHPDADILTTDAALGATSERISEIQLFGDDSWRGLDRAKVGFIVRLGSSGASEDLWLQWDDDAQEWRPSFPIVTVYVVRFRDGFPAGGVTVNGVPVHEVDDGEVQFLAYPGTYRLEYEGAEPVDIRIAPLTNDNLTSLPE